MTTLTATSGPDAVAKLKAALPGAVVTLPPGPVAGFNLKAIVKAAPGVILTGAADGSTVLAWLGMSECEGIGLQDFEVVAATGSSGAAVNISKSKRFAIGGLMVSGNRDSASPGDNGQTGISLRNCADVTIGGCELSFLAYGISHLDCDRVTITGNKVHDFRIDAIRGGGTSFLTVTDNAIFDAYPLAGDHSDGIQNWTTKTTKPTTDILIAGNDIRVGKGRPFQGILIGNEANIDYERVVIRRNSIVGSIWHAISLSGADGGLIEDNLVLGFLGTKDEKGQTITPWIMLRESKSGTLRNNITPKMNPYLSSGYVETGNVIIPLVEPGDLSRLVAWQGVEPTKPPVVAADPRDAEILELQKVLAAEEADDAALIARADQLQTALAAAQADLKAVRAVLEIVSADRAEDRAAMDQARAALTAALATHPAA